jgi:hypothetical protein
MAVTTRARTGRTLGLAPCLAVLLVLLAVPASAQSSGELLPDDLLPAWMAAWTPFTIAADLPRTLGRPQPNPNLILPPPRIGLFWTRGNPGALPFEVHDQWSDFRASTSDLSGDYRRPMDPEQATAPGLAALGWRTVEEQGAVIGRVVSDQRTTAGSPAVSLRPYGSSPFTAVDTTRAEVRDTRTRMEGAGGWRIGRFGVGLAGGFEAHEHRTKATGLPRFGRSAAPAASAGVVANLGDDTRIGAYARWSGFAETTQMVAITRDGLVYGIDGYREPALQGVSSGFPYFLRIEHDARAIGLNAGGDFRGLTWTGFVEGDRMRQTRWNERSEDSPPKDRWAADAWSAGLAAQRSLVGVLWTLDARWTTLSGNGRLAEVEEVEFEADESAVTASLEARLPLGDRPWTAAIRASLAYETRDRVDPVAGLATAIQTLTPGLAASAGFAPRHGTVLTAGLGRMQYRTRGDIPASGSEGPAYRRVLAPEIALLASQAATWTMSLGAGHRVADHISLWIHAERGSLSPGGFRVPQFRPEGDRSITHLAVGVTLTQ